MAGNQISCLPAQQEAPAHSTPPNKTNPRLWIFVMYTLGICITNEDTEHFWLQSLKSKSLVLK